MAVVHQVGEVAICECENPQVGALNNSPITWNGLWPSALRGFPVYPSPITLLGIAFERLRGGGRTLITSVAIQQRKAFMLCSVTTMDEASSLSIVLFNAS
jgi:hypothetical protein